MSAITSLNKASGGDGIPVELFQFLKDDAVKALHSICRKFGKLSSGCRTGNGQFPILKKGNAKESPKCHTTALISHATKVRLKILPAMLQQYMNQELPDVQARFRKRRGTRDQISSSWWIIEKAREFQKNIYFCFIDYMKAF